MIVTTSKTLYHYESELGHIKALESLGFQFDDQGDGFCEIFGEPQMELASIAIFQDWVEVLVGTGKIQILDWMSSDQLMGN